MNFHKPRRSPLGLHWMVLRRLLKLFFWTRPTYTEPRAGEGRRLKAKINGVQARGEKGQAAPGPARAYPAGVAAAASAKLPMPMPKPKPTRKSRARSVSIRVVDCGSSNAAEQEILALFNPVYDAERLGFHLVASPRHADLLLITGPITRNMRAALLAAFRAMPEPRKVITIGDDIAVDSLFSHSYAVVDLPEEIVAARIAHIPGDPPTPEKVLEVLTQCM